IVLGLAIPPLLILHILGTRVAHEVLGVNDNYTYVLLVYFVFSPLLGLKQAAVLVVAWVHGCIGLHFWLRLRPWYRQALPVLYGAALVVPTLALAGMWVAGRDVARLAVDPAWLAAARADIAFADATGLALISRLEGAVLLVLTVLLGVVAMGRWVRAGIERRRVIVYITYPNGRRVRVSAGTTILEASRGAKIPHASVCGGRGRCTTCRVQIGAGLKALAPPSEAEARMLRRIGAAPNVRLACQTRPSADVEVTPLLPSTATPRRAGARDRQGEEREVAVLFADLRDFTSFAEDRLPYDVVFVLNRYFAAMGTAVEEAGGCVDKFIGDGCMALFVDERGVEASCRAALVAARRMAERLVEVNAALRHDLASPLRIGIGIHSGPVILGEMGYGTARTETAIGDTVNTASRLEAMTKDLGAQLVLSEPVARAAGFDLSAYPRDTIEVRGHAEGMCVHVVKNARSLPAGDVAPAVGSP
ncbi:MAG: adenylate/guanylate cyclase domain-containing protein, partial [Kiloniellaceae bacterium]